MKKTFLAALFMTVASAALAQTPANQKAINTGGVTGAYHSTFCPPLPGVLANAYFQGYQCTPSAGTIDNINRVLANPTNIGFAQLDVYAREASLRPNDFQKLSVIRTDIACEGLWMVTKNPDLDYGKILGLSRRIKFVLPDPKSGSTASFSYMRSIDPEGLGRVEDKNILHVKDASAVINYVANSSMGEVGFFVQFADPRNSNIKLMVEKDLRIIPVLSRDLLQAKVDGQEVYQAQTFNLTENGWISKGKTATTACTPVAMFTGSQEAFTDRNAKDDAKDMIERVRQIPSEALLPKDDVVAAILKKANRLSQIALEKTLDAVETARKAAEGR